MEWKIENITEITEIDGSGRFVRSKKAKFSVNGSMHTLKISMPDFDKGRTNALVEAEAKKIIAAYGSK